MEDGNGKTSRNNSAATIFTTSCEQQGNSSSSDEFVPDVPKVYKAMAKFACTAKVPLMSLEELTKIFNPTFPFSLVELERNCLEVYEEEKTRIKQTLEKLDGLISLSMDINAYWDDYADFETEESYHDFLCIRAHFIDDNWKPHSWILCYVDRWDGNPPEKCLSDLDIVSKISTITPGDRSNYDELIETVKDQIKEKKKLQIKCQPFQLYCCANLFCQMVEPAFKKIDDIIDKLREIMIGWKSLPMWHITLYKLQQAIDLESEGEFSKEEYNEYPVPSDEEWKKVRYVCKPVDYIYNAAVVLFMTKNPTASLYLHNLNDLRENLRKESMNSDNPFVADMLETFDEYWKEMFLVLAIATVMDPRCKMKYVEFSSLKYDGNLTNSKVTMVLEAIHGIYDDYKMHSLEVKNSITHSHSTPSDSDSTPADSDSEEELPSHTLERLQNCNFGFNCVDEYNEFLKSTNRPRKSDLELYLDEPVEPWSQDFDLMSWWRAEGAKYPILSKMARDLLGIQFSVATSYEAYYYKEFRMADRNIIHLGSDIRNALMCSRSYYEKQ